MKTKNIISVRAVSVFFALTVVLSAGSAFAALTVAKINGVAATTGTACQVTNPPTISVTSSGNVAVWVKFMTQNGATWRLPMTDGGAQYAIVMPVMPAGTISYRVEAGATFDALSDTNAIEFLPSSTTYYTYINSETLGIDRQPDLIAWKTKLPTLSGGSGNIDANWRVGALVMVGDAQTQDYNVILNGNTNTVAHNLDPYFRTRQTITVGSIWFKAKFTGSGNSGTLYVEKSSGAYYDPHQILDEGIISVPYTATWIQYRIDLNTDTPAYYRIRHPSGIEAESIIIKDIVISAPAADVVLFKDEVDYSPGYPSRDDPVTFKVSVTNVIAGAPASNISPKVVWRLNEGAWTQTSMPLIAGNQYGVTLPKMDPGKFEYYYRADFTGYAYTGLFYPTGGNPADNASDFAKLLDADGYLHECKSPATLPDFPDSHLYNLSAEPYPTPRYGGSAYTNGFSYYEFTITE